MSTANILKKAILNSFYSEKPFLYVSSQVKDFLKDCIKQQIQIRNNSNSYAS